MSKYNFGVCVWGGMCVWMHMCTERWRYRALNSTMDDSRVQLCKSHQFLPHLHSVTMTWLIVSHKLWYVTGCTSIAIGQTDGSVKCSCNVMWCNRSIMVGRKTVAGSWHRLDGNTTDGTTCYRIYLLLIDDWYRYNIIHIYLLQLGCYPVAVVIFHVNKTWNWLLLNLSLESYMRSM